MRNTYLTSLAIAYVLGQKGRKILLINQFRLQTMKTILLII